MRRGVLACCVAALVPVAAHARGSLGFSVSVETDGFFSTTLKHVTVDAVTAGKPAQQAGLAAGDEIEAVNDVAIPGASGGRLKDIVDAVQPGDHVRLKIHRGDGEHVIDIVAGPA